jgi:hypothetical protein
MTSTISADGSSFFGSRLWWIQLLPLPRVANVTRKSSKKQNFSKYFLIDHKGWSWSRRSWTHRNSDALCYGSGSAKMMKVP